MKRILLMVLSLISLTVMFYKSWKWIDIWRTKAKRKREHIDQEERKRRGKTKKTTPKETEDGDK